MSQPSSSSGQLFFLNLLDNKLYPCCVNVLFGYSTKDKIILFLDFFITFSFFLDTVSI